MPVPDFIQGNVLNASDLNPWLGARVGNVLPFDAATRNEDDNSEDLGSGSVRWRDCHLGRELLVGSTDLIVIGGTTLTQILEDNVIDQNCSDLVFDSGNHDLATDIDTSFVKVDADKLVRIIFGRSDANDSIDDNFLLTVGTLPSRTYFKEELGGGITDFFDISGEPNGTLNINVTRISGSGIDALVFRLYKNSF